jgi:pyridoxine 5-phosphate synthase
MNRSIRLSVNINKVALIRNARGESRPDIIKFSQDCENFGAEGITAHPRPDERHIRWNDLPLLKHVVTTEFNIEGYPGKKFIDEVLSVMPHQVTLVPDPPNVLTSSTGWDTKNNCDFLTDVIKPFKSVGIRVSLFLNPIPELVEFAAKCGADRIELYTGGFARDFAAGKLLVADHVETAQKALQFGLGVNAGHDLDLNNLAYYAHNVPNLLEVSIGHALISDALYLGISNAIQMYKYQLKTAAPRV